VTPGRNGGLTWFYVTKTWATDQDFYTINTTAGSDLDVFDIMVKLTDPTKIKAIQIGFGISADTDQPRKVGYSFTF